MNIDSITNGIVLDHIKAGKSMQIYQDLELDKLDCSVAIIKNVKSNKLGRKDIIKIDQDYSINLDVLGYIDPDITVSIIKDGKTVEKKKVELPEKLVNIIFCKSRETYIPLHLLRRRTSDHELRPGHLLRKKVYKQESCVIISLVMLK